MRASTSLCAGLIALAACRNEPPRRAPVARPAPAVTATRNADAAPVADASVAAVVDAPSDVPIAVYRLGESLCVRDPARRSLGASAHGSFTGDHLDLEVRNVRFACAPAPTFSVEVSEGTVHLRYTAAAPAAIARCGCPHDGFLQVTGVAPGAYELVVEEVTARTAAPRVVATGRVDAPATSGAATNG